MTTPQRSETHEADTAARRWRRRLAAPVDIAVLVYFRIAFGAIMVWEMWRFIDHGWIDRYYTDKPLYFSYWPFTFVEPLPEPWIHLVFWATMAAAAMVTVGLYYRVAAPAMFVGLAYIFLLERARYLNHFYLIVLIAFLLCFLLLHRSMSVDAWRGRSTRSASVPTWTLWLLRFQIAVPYFLGGVAKLNADWLRREPLRAWLAARTDFPLLGRFFTDEPVVWAMTYGSLVLRDRGSHHPPLLEQRSLRPHRQVRRRHRRSRHGRHPPIAQSRHPSPTRRGEDHRRWRPSPAPRNRSRRLFRSAPSSHRRPPL